MKFSVICVNRDLKSLRENFRYTHKNSHIYRIPPLFSKLQISPQYTYKLGSTPRAGAGAGAGAASWSWCACAGAASWCASMENESWMRCELDALELDAEENVRDR